MMFSKSLRAILPVLFFLFAGAASADWWDPFNWFQTEEEILQENLTPATPAEELQAKELYEQGMRAYNEGNLGRAENRLEKVAEDFYRTRVAPDSLLQVAQIRFERNRFKKAFDTAASVIRRYPDYQGFDDAIRLQFEIATSLMEGERGRMFGIIPKFRAPGAARSFFERIIAAAPYSEYSPMALMNIALISQEQSEQDYAIDALDRLINFYPNTMLSPDAYYMLGEIFSSMVDGPYYDQSSTRKAISYYEDFLILYPTSPYANRAEEGLREMREVSARSKYLLGEFYYRYRFNTTAALVFYNETITVAPNSETAEQARGRIERIRQGERPPRYGLGITQWWKYIRGNEVEKSASQVAREQEELDKSEQLPESEVIPAPARPRG